METSETIGDLAVALASASAELSDVQHDARNPHLRNRYATLSAVLTAARPVLTRHGLSLTQWLGGEIAERGAVSVTTQLTHRSGQYLRSTVSAAVERQKGISVAQAGGVQISYLRRYAALAALGVASADDVDGHVDAAPQRAAPQRAAPPAPEKRWGDADRKRFCAALSGWGLEYGPVAAWCESKGKPRPSGMLATDRAKLLAWLEPMQSDERRSIFAARS